MAQDWHGPRKRLLALVGTRIVRKYYSTCSVISPQPWSYTRSATATQTAGNGILGRYKATLEEVQARYVEWELIGPAEIRETSAPSGAYFHPYGKLIAHAELMRITEPAGGAAGDRCGRGLAGALSIVRPLSLAA